MNRRSRRAGHRKHRPVVRNILDIAKHFYDLCSRVIPPGGIGQFNDTGVGLSLLYGDGTYGVSGTIGVAPFEFGPYKIEQQGRFIPPA